VGFGSSHTNDTLIICGTHTRAHARTHTQTHTYTHYFIMVLPQVILRTLRMNRQQLVYP